MWLLFLSSLVEAAPRSSKNAEATRRYEEMQSLAQRTVWSGVDRNYRKLVELKASYPPYAHLLGARAAQASGDVRSARERAVLAIKAADGDQETLTEASTFLAEFEVHHGPVSLILPANMDAPGIYPLTPSFVPDANAAIAFAVATLEAEGKFQGFLPLGQYRLGGTAFDVFPGDVAVQVVASEGGPPPPEPVAIAPKPSNEPSIVVLRAEGAEWMASNWSDLADAVIVALREVEGVTLVDRFQPDQPWVVVTLDSAAVDAAEIEPTVLAEAFPTPWSNNEAQWCHPPPHTLAARAVSARLIGATPLSQLGEVHAEEAPACQVDEAHRTHYRIEVKVAGDPNRLLDAVKTVEGADRFGFTLEAPATP